MSFDRNGFATRLGILFKEKKAEGYTQDRIAKYLGYERKAIMYWLRGEFVPRADTVYSICCLCNCSVDWLLGLSNNRFSQAENSQLFAENEKSKKQLETIESDYDFYKRNGICVQCHRNTISNNSITKTMCESCIERSVEQSRKRYEKKKRTMIESSNLFKKEEVKK